MRQASYKGRTFYVESTSVKYNRRKVIHEFPNHDKSVVEDMGKNTNQFTINGFLSGNSWENERDLLVKKCLEKTSGMLVHPDFGEVKVYCESVSHSESKKTANRYCELQFNFVEDTQSSPPISTTNTAQVLQSSGQKALTILTDVFKNTLNISNLPEYVLNSILGQYSQLGNVAKKYSNSALISESEVLVNTVSESSETHANNILNVFNTFGDKPESDYRIQKEIYTSLTLPILTDITPLRVAEKTAVECVHLHLLSMCKVVEAITISQFTFRSRDEARDILKQSLLQFEDLLAITKSLVAYRALNEVKDNMILHISSYIPTLPNAFIKEYQTTLPSLVIAYDSLEDINLEKAFIFQNPNIKHPGFVSGQISIIK
jgi:prophage DNA circulation protein